MKEHSSEQKHSPTRRQFLQATGSTLAAGSVLATTPTWTEASLLKNTAHTLHATKGNAIGEDEASMIERLQELKQLGFDGVESHSPGIADIKALRRAMKKVDFPIHGLVNKVHWRQRLSDPDPKVRQIGQDAMQQAIKDANFLGASSVLLVPGKVTGENENHDQVWERSIKEIRKFMPLASRLGVYVLIENVWNGFCETPEEFRDYIDEIDHPWCGAYFDIGNCRKFSPSEDWIRTLGERTIKLDVKDWGKENGFCRLGEGDVNWKEVTKALNEINFKGWATREGADHDEADTSKLMDKLLPV
ncbi:Sugar phosphate isomerase/epimerase [Planctomycetales bacterium 10988]|nr:Sugar phosphate isomerase/epimerase [Planctomycetales bacterium 10988]